MAKTIVVGDEDLVITVRNERLQMDGETVYRAPVLKVFVGDKQIGMLSHFDLKAGTDRGSGVEVNAKFFDGMSPEVLATISDRARTALKEYLEILSKVPCVKVSVPEFPEPINPALEVLEPEVD